MWMPSLVLLDARIPLSSLNPEIERITARQAEAVCAEQGGPGRPRRDGRVDQILPCGRCRLRGHQRQAERQREKPCRLPLKKSFRPAGPAARTAAWRGAKTQVMLCGIPNVGKSTFINNVRGHRPAPRRPTRPGVTRGKQWVTVGNYDLLDMPGVLWKKFDSLETIATNLAFIGSIKDDILDIEELAMGLAGRRCRRDLSRNRLAQRYKLSEQQVTELGALGTGGSHRPCPRSCSYSGGEVNTERCRHHAGG